jgi:hypothetical protein
VDTESSRGFQGQGPDLLPRLELDLGSLLYILGKAATVPLFCGLEGMNWLSVTQVRSELESFLGFLKALWTIKVVPLIDVNLDSG